METTPIIPTTSKIIDDLGGTGAVARLTNRGQTAVSNWRRNDTFPPELYLVMSGALREMGVEAPPSLWRQESPSASEHRG